MNFNSAANTDELHSDNKSSGWAVGVKVGVSASGGAGVSVFANVNKAKGNADGSSLTHTETQITATDRLNLNVGRDLNMTGTQARGNSVDVEVGRNLTITSEQDSSDYESRQKSMSAGVEIPVYGAGSASANLSMSKQKIDSTYDSVNEQSGLFAGEGGSNVNVKGHTQLNGGTIASTADATRNNFSTGSLGFSNIENHAEYEASSSGMNFSTGGSMLSLAAQTLSSAIPAANNQSGESSSTTHASISAGNITIGGKEATAEQLNGLSRDTSDSANALKPIFDLEKVQDRMAMATVVGEIGALATSITAKALERAEYVARDKALADAESKLTKEQKEYYDNNKDFKEHPELKEAWLLEQSSPSQTTALSNNPEYKALYDSAETAGDKAAIIDQMERKGLFGALAQANQLYLDDQKKHGPGSPYATAAQAISGLAVGIAGGNIQQGLSNAAAPYLAGVVGLIFDNMETGPDGQKHPTDESRAGRLLAHAAVGAAVAYASGGDAASGAAGAVIGEALAMIIMQQEYPGLTANQLTNEQKEHIRAIATLASALVGAATGNSFEAATTAAAAGYNATSNNQVRNGAVIRTYNGQRINMTESQAITHDLVAQRILILRAEILRNGGSEPAAIRPNSEPLTSRDLRPFETMLRSVSPNHALLGGTGSISSLTVRPLNPLPSFGQGTMTQAQYEAVLAANRPFGTSGQTQAARAWDKHDTSRPGGTYPPARGNQEAKNANAANFVNSTVTNPNVVITTLPRGGTEYRLPNGQGFRVEPNGNFNLLDPRNY